MKKLLKRLVDVSIKIILNLMTDTRDRNTSTPIGIICIIIKIATFWKAIHF